MLQEAVTAVGMYRVSISTGAPAILLGYYGLPQYVLKYAELMFLNTIQPPSSFKIHDYFTLFYDK
jgi:hypothetical protein